MSKTQKQWNKIFWGMLIPIVTLMIFRLIFFPNTSLDSLAFGGIGICFIGFILARIFEWEVFDVVISYIVCISLIILYILHWSLGWFV